jgi:hypothetical protein
MSIVDGERRHGAIMVCVMRSTAASRALGTCTIDRPLPRILSGHDSAGILHHIHNPQLVQYLDIGRSVSFEHLKQNGT